MAKITDRFRSLPAWQKVAIVLLGIGTLIVSRVIFRIFATILLLAVPIVFINIIASEDLRNSIKSSDFFKKLPGFSRDMHPIFMALLASGYLLVGAAAFSALNIALFSITAPKQAAQRVTTGDPQSQKQDSGSNQKTNAGNETTTTVQQGQQKQGQQDTSTAQSLPVAESTAAAASSRKASASSYELVHILYEQRNDGGINCYVLIKPINPASGTMKSKVEKIIRELVREKGRRITIDIFDNETALDIYFKLWGIQELTPPLSDKQDNLILRHHIATFEGATEIGPSENTVIIFPSATKNSPVVGGYVETYDFTP